jgi:plasmid stability protein
MKNITITLDEQIAQWARVYAARHDTSVSHLLGELLRVRMLSEEGYDVAMRQFLSVSPRPLKRGAGYPTREQVHQRGLE